LPAVTIGLPSTVFSMINQDNAVEGYVRATESTVDIELPLSGVSQVTILAQSREHAKMIKSLALKVIRIR
jgi:hypothetical protein